MNLHTLMKTIHGSDANIVALELLYEAMNDSLISFSLQDIDVQWQHLLQVAIMMLVYNYSETPGEAKEELAAFGSDFLALSEASDKLYEIFKANAQ